MPGRTMSVPHFLKLPRLMTQSLNLKKSESKDTEEFTKTNKHYVYAEEP